LDGCDHLLLCFFVIELRVRIDDLAALTKGMTLAQLQLSSPQVPAEPDF